MPASGPLEQPQRDDAGSSHRPAIATETNGHGRRTARVEIQSAPHEQHAAGDADRGAGQQVRRSSRGSCSAPPPSRRLRLGRGRRRADAPVAAEADVVLETPRSPTRCRRRLGRRAPARPRCTRGTAAPAASAAACSASSASVRRAATSWSRDDPAAPSTPAGRANSRASVGGGHLDDREARRVRRQRRADAGDGGKTRLVGDEHDPVGAAVGVEGEALVDDDDALAWRAGLRPRATPGPPCRRRPSRAARSRRRARRRRPPSPDGRRAPCSCA